MYKLSTIIIIVFVLFNQVYSAQFVISGKPNMTDATIYSNGTTDNGGSGTTNFAGQNGISQNRRLLLWFNLSSIPSTASIDSVLLQLTVTQVPTGSVAATHTLYKVLNSWSEGTGIASGTGGQTAPGGVAWNFRQYPSLLWLTAGGDYSLSGSGATNVGTGTGSLFQF